MLKVMSVQTSLVGNVKDFKSFVYEQICDKVILKYDMKDLGIDDVVETEEVVGE